ncbi:MAG TPA: MATE family efflux transporter, partial [Thermoanaerobaculia bacterium]|nr:MATE family efflux transporter [Thermoanaerobaculia bacterium]
MTRPASLFRRELRQLFVLALPLAGAQAGTQLMNVVDVAILGHVGARELGGAGLASAMFFAVAITGMGMVFGIDPMISQALGANDHQRARRLLWQGVWLALVVSAVLTIPLLFAPRLLPLLHVKAELIEPATAFLLVRTTGLIPLLLFYVVRGYLQALHITRPMIVAMLICNVVNFFGDLLFVFGGERLPPWTGPLRAFPAFGAAGAAMVTVIA